jgi:hypothetical protein
MAAGLPPEHSLPRCALFEPTAAWRRAHFLSGKDFAKDNVWQKVTCSADRLRLDRPACHDKKLWLPLSNPRSGASAFLHILYLHVITLAQILHQYIGGGSLHTLRVGPRGFWQRVSMKLCASYIGTRMDSLTSQELPSACGLLFPGRRATGGSRRKREVEERPDDKAMTKLVAGSRSMESMNGGRFG